MAEVARSDTSSPDTDKDFDPSADMMVHEYDDERTLDEEEAMTSGESCTGELDDLQKESEIPIEELLAQYSAATTGSVVEPADNSRSTTSSSEEEILESQNLTLDKEAVARDLLNSGAPAEDRDISVNELLQNVSRSQAERLLRSTSHPESDDSSSSSEDENYDEPVEEHKKGFSTWQDKDHFNIARERPALWPSGKALAQRLGDAALDGYLCNVQREMDRKLHAVASIPRGRHIRDDEQALFLLLQCDNNIEEAERRRKMQAVPPTDVMSLWSEDECRNFEDGLRLYGKNFHEIHHNKVRTRSVFELVHFYYLWKKTERHDVFAAKTRAEKRKYSLNPGVMDHMERFLEEQEVELHQLIVPQATSELKSEQIAEDEHLRASMGLFSTGRTTIMSPSRHIERNPSKGEQPVKRSHHHHHHHHQQEGEVNGNNIPSELISGNQSPKKLKTELSAPPTPEEPSPKKQKLNAAESASQDRSPHKPDGAAGASSLPTNLPASSQTDQTGRPGSASDQGSESKHIAASSNSSSQAASSSGVLSASGASGDFSNVDNKNLSSDTLPTSSSNKGGKSVSVVGLSMAGDISNGVLKTISAADTAAV
ncbi:mesoderm induction early response protein 1-like [Elysia marginata]|uniref:Mesoderm induction early response protein 1-like n=1 Tax=Elysia marginata TaxID=1093978 RepID=A0AAV4G175_9GAST|nr:mesoderm induction early response protein 1-like [Elysia marginata]